MFNEDKRTLEKGQFLSGVWNMKRYTCIAGSAQLRIFKPNFSDLLLQQIWMSSTQINIPLMISTDHLQYKSLCHHWGTIIANSECSGVLWQPACGLFVISVFRKSHPSMHCCTNWHRPPTLLHDRDQYVFTQQPKSSAEPAEGVELCRLTLHELVQMLSGYISLSHAPTAPGALLDIIIVVIKWYIYIINTIKHQKLFLPNGKHFPCFYKLETSRARK